MVGTTLGTKGRNPIKLSKYKRNRGNHKWEEARVIRGRQRKKTNREKKEKRIRKSSGKVVRVMVETRACINRSIFLSP